MVELRPVMFGDVIFDDLNHPRWRVLVRERDASESSLVTLDLLDHFERRPSLWWPLTWRGRKATLRYAGDDELPRRRVLLNLNEMTTRIIQMNALRDLLLPSARCAVQPLVDAFPQAGAVVTTQRCDDLRIDVMVPCTIFVLRHYLVTLRQMLDGSFISDKLGPRETGGAPDLREKELLSFMRIAEDEQKASTATSRQFIATLMRQGAAQLFAVPPMRGSVVAEVRGMVFSNGSTRRQYVADDIAYLPVKEDMLNQFSCGFLDGHRYKPLPTREAVSAELNARIPESDHVGFQREIVELSLPSTPDQTGFFDKTGYYVPFTHEPPRAALA